MNMTVRSNRFGAIETVPDTTIDFPSGLIGFPGEREFILVRHSRSDTVAWLQSTTNPELAFPVVSAHGFAGIYPDVPLEQLARNHGVGDDGGELAVMAVLSAPQGGPATVNLLAPIVVDPISRKGAQIFLEGTRFSTRELYFAPREQERETDPAPPMLEEPVGECCNAAG